MIEYDMLRNIFTNRMFEIENDDNMSVNQKLKRFDELENILHQIKLRLEVIEMGENEDV